MWIFDCVGGQCPYVVQESIVYVAYKCIYKKLNYLEHCICSSKIGELSEPLSPLLFIVILTQHVPGTEFQTFVLVVMRLDYFCLVLGLIYFVC